MWGIDSNSIINKLAACDNLLKDWNLNTLNLSIDPPDQHAAVQNPALHGYQFSPSLRSLYLTKRQVTQRLATQEGGHEDMVAGLHVAFGELLQLENEMKMQHGEWKRRLVEIRYELNGVGVVPNEFGAGGEGARNYQFEQGEADDGEGGEGETQGSPKHGSPMHSSHAGLQDSQFVELLDSQRQAHGHLEERIESLEVVAAKTLKIVQGGESKKKSNRSVMTDPEEVEEEEEEDGHIRHMKLAAKKPGLKKNTTLTISPTSDTAMKMRKKGAKETTPVKMVGKGGEVLALGETSVTPKGSRKLSFFSEFDRGEEANVKGKKKVLRKKESSLQKKESSLQKKESSLQKKESSLQKKSSSLQKKSSSLQKKSSSLQRQPSFTNSKAFKPGGRAGAESHDSTNFNRYLGRTLSVGDL